MRTLTAPPGVLRAVAALLAVLVGIAPVGAASYYFAVDVPATLGTLSCAPHQILRGGDGGYAVETGVSPGLELLALERRADGAWLFTPADPFTLGDVSYMPRDVVAFDGASFARLFDGASAGIPEYARIDSLFLDGSGEMVFSFDVPVNLGGVEYGRSDLVRHGAGFSLYWDAEAAGVPSDANLVGAALDAGGTLVLTFDVPTKLGDTWRLPGDLVRWNGSAWGGSLFETTSWPRTAQLRDFGFEPVSGAGAVPDGSHVPGVPLTADREPDGRITLRWGASCGAGDDDYEIYEGPIGEFAGHEPKLCTTGGQTTATFAPGADSVYYLVVARNSHREGSYGRRSDGSERPPAAAACVPQEIGACQ